MSIVHVRVDERLIHGQVANMWTNNLRITRIMVVDEEAAKNDILKMSLKLATPSGVALSVLSVSRAIERIREGGYRGQRVMLEVKSVDTLVRLVKNGIAVEKVNLGNISYAEGKKRVSTYVNLGPEEWQGLRWLQSQGIQVVIQLIPTAHEELLEEDLEMH